MPATDLVIAIRRLADAESVNRNTVPSGALAEIGVGWEATRKRRADRLAPLIIGAEGGACVVVEVVVVVVVVLVLVLVLVLVVVVVVVVADAWTVALSNSCRCGALLFGAAVVPSASAGSW